MEKTAGMVHGTPDWQLDRMYEEESARIWAQQNAEPAEPVMRISGKKRLEAWSYIEVAILADLDLAEEWLISAHGIIRNTPQGDKLAGLIDQITDLRMDLRQIQQEIKGKGFRA